MARTPVAIVAKVKELVNATTATVVYQGLVLKARILNPPGASPVVGDAVIMEYLPLSSEWYIVVVI